MDLKLENLDTNGSADEQAGYIDQYNFWVDTRETSDENAIGHFCFFGAGVVSCCLEASWKINLTKNWLSLSTTYKKETCGEISG